MRRMEAKMAGYTLVVGTRNWSSWSLRPFTALWATGAPFETVVIALRQGAASAEAIQKHSPTGKVPVLKIAGADGTAIVWDSLAICETLAERHPEAGLWPHDWKARARARALSAEMHSGYPDLRDQLPMDFARRLPLPQLREETRQQIGRVADAWQSALADSGGPFLFGRFSIADAMFAPVVSRFLTYGVEVAPALRGYMDSIMALPAMRDWAKGAQQEVDAGTG
jgi:glutathione S-transferase